MSFIVHVVRDDQEPVEGARVALGIVPVSLFPLPMCITEDEYTDEDGHAYFELDWEVGEVKVFINGHDYGKYPSGDGESITITI